MALLEIWRFINKGKSWVLFKNGTCVGVPGSPRDAAEEAKNILREHGPVTPGTSSGDFSVEKAAGAPGWIISFDHPDIRTYVGPDELETGDADDMIVGLIGRGKRKADAQALDVVHVEKSS